MTMWGLRTESSLSRHRLESLLKRETSFKAKRKRSRRKTSYSNLQYSDYRTRLENSNDSKMWRNRRNMSKTKVCSSWLNWVSEAKTKSVRENSFLDQPYLLLRQPRNQIWTLLWTLQVADRALLGETSTLRCKSYLSLGVYRTIQ